MSDAASHSNLFVGNLNKDATEERLRQAFSAFGAIESCRVVSKDDVAKGFVKMADADSAQRAIASMNGINGLIVKLANFDIGGKQKMYGGRGKGGGKGGGWGKGGWGNYMMWGFSPPKLYPRNEESEKPEGPASENLYTKHWPVGVTEDQVKQAFAKVGEVVECHLLRLNYSLEWAALLKMATPEQAAAARQTMDDTHPDISTEPLMVKLQTKNGEPKDDHCYITGLPTNSTKESIEKLFGQYGEVKWCNVLPAATSGRVQPTSAALVEMGAPEQCQKAIAALNEQTVPLSQIGSTIRVRYAIQKDKGEPEAEAGASK